MKKRDLECLELCRLREQAKFLKKSHGMKICHAYHALALSLGYTSWVSLLSDKGWS